MAAQRTREDMNREAREISQRLTDRIEDLAPVLLPEGARWGDSWREGAKGSKSIILTGARRGVFSDFELGGKGTDMLGAVAQLLCNGSLKEAVIWAKGWLGWDDSAGYDHALADRRAKERRESSEADHAKFVKKRQRQSRGIWHNAGPLAGSMAERYLTETRGIDLARLDRLPGAIRFGDAYCAERKGNYPAMLSSLWKQGDPEMIAVHRTYLAQDATGRVDKARIAAPRSILGSWPGAVIPIQRGETNRRWRDIQEGDLVAFGEGIEEGLSIGQVQPTWRVGAVGFSGNFALIELPVWCHIVLAVNNDPPGSQADVAIKKAVPQLEDRGHVVRVARPPQRFADWNDFLRGIARDQ